MKIYSRDTYLLILLILTITICHGCTPNKQQTTNSNFSMTIFDTGKSDCILIEAEGLVIINDTADYDDYDDIRQSLDTKKIQFIDYLIISHYDKDHIGSAALIINNYDVGCVIMPNCEEDSSYYTDLIKAIADKGITTINTDYSINKGELSIDVDAPLCDYYEDDNNYSMITSVHYKDSSFLLLGDALKIRMEEYTSSHDEYDYDVVKMPHHGDYNKVIANMVPLMDGFTAVITDDKDEPRTEDKLVELLEANECKIIYTYNGNVVITSDGNSVSVQQ